MYEGMLRPLTISESKIKGLGLSSPAECLHNRCKGNRPKEEVYGTAISLGLLEFFGDFWFSWEGWDFLRFLGFLDFFRFLVCISVILGFSWGFWALGDSFGIFEVLRTFKISLEFLEFHWAFWIL